MRKYELFIMGILLIFMIGITNGCNNKTSPTEPTESTESTTPTEPTTSTTTSTTKTKTPVPDIDIRGPNLRNGVLSFGNVPLGSSKENTLNLYNVGKEGLIIYSFDPEGGWDYHPDFWPRAICPSENPNCNSGAWSFPHVIMPGKILTFFLVFHPVGGPGYQCENFKFQTNDPDEKTVKIKFCGTGTGT